MVSHLELAAVETPGFGKLTLDQQNIVLERVRQNFLTGDGKGDLRFDNYEQALAFHTNSVLKDQKDNARSGKPVAPKAFVLGPLRRHRPLRR
jgi:hypothetical protein